MGLAINEQAAKRGEVILSRIKSLKDTMERLQKQSVAQDEKIAALQQQTMVREQQIAELEREVGKCCHLCSMKIWST